MVYFIDIVITEFMNKLFHENGYFGFIRSIMLGEYNNFILSKCLKKG